MARMSRAEVFSPDQIAIVHVVNRVVRRSWLMGTDSLTGKNYDHRKPWVEAELERAAACFGIDLLCFAILSNHFHLVLRSRPDVVGTWNNGEVARRWLTLCPVTRRRQRSKSEAPEATDAAPPPAPTDKAINRLCSDAKKIKNLRSRLSDISWWMRLVCQRIAQRSNREDDEVGHFWASRFRAVRLIDEAAILACSAYVDLNPIRAAMAERLETSQFTSVKCRIEALNQALSAEGQEASQQRPPADTFLAPLEIDEQNDELGPRPSSTGTRCSDKGFLPMPTAAYLELLDWTARQSAPDKIGTTPESAPSILERLKIAPDKWCQLVCRFGALFSLVAGRPQQVDNLRSLKQKRRFYLGKEARELLGTADES